MLRVVCSIDWPTRWVTESSRSFDGARHVGLAPGQRLSHCIDAAGGFALGAEHFAQPLFQFVGAFGAAAPGSRDDDGDNKQQQQCKRREPGQCRVDPDRPIADHEKDIVHAAL